MKRALFGLLFFGCSPLLLAEEEEPFPPQPIPESRYEKMMERSPFVLPTMATVEVTPDWTSDFHIVSVISLGDKSVVLARKVSTDERFPIRSEENAQGMRLVELNMSPDPSQVSAVIEMGGNEGTITYDPANLSDNPRSELSDNPALKNP